MYIKLKIITLTARGFFYKSKLLFPTSGHVFGHQKQKKGPTAQKRDQKSKSTEFSEDDWKGFLSFHFLANLGEAEERKGSLTTTLQCLAKSPSKVRVYRRGRTKVPGTPFLSLCSRRLGNTEKTLKDPFGSVVVVKPLHFCSCSRPQRHRKIDLKILE